MKESKELRESHMENRHKDYGSIRKAAEEFGVSKSTFHRIIQSRNKLETDKGNAS